MKKITLEYLKENSKRVYPASLKEVVANKYKVDGYDGYLHKDESVLNLFYRSKWREDKIFIVTPSTKIPNEPIYVDITNREVVKLSNEGYGIIHKVDGILCTKWEDGSYSLVKNIFVITGLKKYSKLHLTLNKVNSNYSFQLSGFYDLDLDYELNSISYGLKTINFIEDDFKSESERDNAIGKLYIIIAAKMLKNSIVDVATTYKEEFESDSVVITKDNIHLYYEFMSNDDLEKHKHLLNKVFIGRSTLFSDFYSSLNNAKVVKNLDGDRFLKVTIFGVKDILKPIDEYISEIKESSEYKEYMSPSVKSEDASLVLQMMDNDISYCDALEKVLKISTISKEELEKELDLYI